MNKRQYKRRYNKKLRDICKNCLSANGQCIKNEPAYIGLCAKNDKEELIELWENKSNGK